jgi:hypothetical protein
MQDKISFEKPLTEEMHLFGKDFIVKLPSICEQSDYEKLVRECKDDSEVVEVILDYLDSLGIEKEYAKKLHRTQMQTVMSRLTGQDKKK